MLDIVLARKIWRIFSVILTIAIIGLAILLVGVRFIGLTPYVVLSGSMEPTYSTGSLIYVKKIAPAKVQVGDAITFNLNGKNIVATHRAVEVDLINEHFITKGDANESVDGSSVKFSNLIGKPVFCIPFLGYISYFLTSLPTLYIVVAIVVVLLIILFFPSQKCNGQKAIIKRRF